MKRCFDNDLEFAIRISLFAHAGQTDKGEEPYIQHPLRVMDQMDSQEEKIVAVLHDVVEDSYITFEELEDHFPDRTMSAIRCVTKRDGESYQQFIQRAKNNEIARKVKIADIEDNLDVTRLGELDRDGLERMRKYKRSLAILKEDY